MPSVGASCATNCATQNYGLIRGFKVVNFRGKGNTSMSRKEDFVRLERAHLVVLKQYSTLTGIPIKKIVDEAVADHIECCVSVGLEELASKKASGESSKVHTMDEADLLFGDESKKLPVDEGTLISSEAFRKLSLKKKLRTQDQFRTANASQKLKMLDRFLGPVRPEMRPFLPPSLGGTQPE